MQGGKENTTVREVMLIFQRIEKWETRNEKNVGKGNGNPNNRKRNSNNNNRGDGNPRTTKNLKGNGNEVKNHCKLPGHKSHAYKNCFNNPNSDKFKGTSKKIRDYNEDGSLKKKSPNENNHICEKVSKKKNQ